MSDPIPVFKSALEFAAGQARYFIVAVAALGK